MKRLNNATMIRACNQILDEHIDDEEMTLDNINLLEYWRDKYADDVAGRGRRRRSENWEDDEADTDW